MVSSFLLLFQLLSLLLEQGSLLFFPNCLLLLPREYLQPNLSMTGKKKKKKEDVGIWKPSWWLI